MRLRTVLALMAAVPFATAYVGVSQAACSLPYTITNGTPADATEVMANFNALLACINANAGSGLYSQILSDTPTIASTGLANWLNQGSSTVSDTGVGMTISAPSSGSSENLVVRYKAAPATPYTITALISVTRSSTSHNGIGIGWYDGTAKLHVINFGLNAAATNRASPRVQRWNSVTSHNSTDIILANSGYSLPLWMRIADDGTSVSFWYSQDGAEYYQVLSVAKASGFLGTSGYSNIAFFVNPKESQTFGTLLSWDEN